MKRKIPALLKDPIHNSDRLAEELNVYLKAHDVWLQALARFLRNDLYYGPFRILRFTEHNETKLLESVDEFEKTINHLKHLYRRAAQDLEMARQFLAKEDLTAEQQALAESFIQMREKDAISLKQQFEQAEALLPKAHQAQVEWIMRLMTEFGYVRGQIGDN